MNFKYVAFTRSTARKNPYMIKREYERIISEAQTHLKNKIKDYENVNVEIVISNDVKVCTAELFPNETKYVVKLADLKVITNPKTKREWYMNHDAPTQTAQGKSAIKFIEEANEKLEKEIQFESERIEAIIDEKVRFINKYVSKWV